MSDLDAMHVRPLSERSPSQLAHSDPPGITPVWRVYWWNAAADRRWRAGGWYCCEETCFSWDEVLGFLERLQRPPGYRALVVRSR
jgi:hypothetical protein